MTSEPMPEGRFSRGVAYKIPIMDITKGTFEPADSEEDVNYLLTPFNEKISRCRIMATVVSRHVGEEQRFAFLTLDDATDTISARAFGEEVELVKDFKPGDIVDVIGKIREYQGEKYVNIESMTKIDEPNWELVRKLEILWHDKESGKKRGQGGEISEERFVGAVEEDVVSDDSKALITSDERSTGSSATQILFRTSFPLGRTSWQAVANPFADPVQSTTTSHSGLSSISSSGMA